MRQEKTYPKNTTLEAIIIDITERWEEDTQPGHGMFFDFSAAPEIEKPIIDYMTKGFGWKLEYPTFLRKPKE